MFVILLPRVVLHNLCETAGDVCLAEWIRNMPPDPPIPIHATSTGRQDGAHIRNSFVQYFSTT